MVFLKGVWHCFCGTLEQAKQALDIGFMLGIGGIFTYKNTPLKRIINHIPLSCVLLETDAPYLSPIPHRGKRNEPSYLSYVLRALAHELGVAESEVSHTTSYNAKKLFNLP